MLSLVEHVAVWVCKKRIPHTHVLKTHESQTFSPELLEVKEIGIESLRSIGVAAISEEDGKLHPMAAGMLMFGGESNPRNKALMKMFNLINIDERAGSGVPNIFNVWADEGWEEPIIEERFDPNRTVLTLSFKQYDDKNRR